MVNRLSEVLTMMLYKNTNISFEESEQINYALNVILGEGIKLLLLFIVFTIVDKLGLFLFSLIILISIRTFSGGIHLKSNLKCFIASLVFFLTTCIFSEVSPNIPMIAYYILALVSIIVIFTGSPKPSIYRPVSRNMRRLKLKLLSTVSTAIWFIILFFYIKNLQLFKCGFLTIVIQAIQLVEIQNGKKVKVCSNQKKR